MALIESSQRCTKCHSTTGVAGPIEPGRIGKPQDWVVSHVADPEMIAPGLREAPAGNDRDIAAIAKRITNPVDVKLDAETPAFGSKFSPDVIRAIAQWFATRQ